MLLLLLLLHNLFSGCQNISRGGTNRLLHHFPSSVGATQHKEEEEEESYFLSREREDHLSLPTNTRAS